MEVSNQNGNRIYFIISLQFWLLVVTIMYLRFQNI